MSKKCSTVSRWADGYKMMCIGAHMGPIKLVPPRFLDICTNFKTLQSSRSVFVILNRFWNNYGCLYLRRVWIFRGHHWLDLLQVYTDFRCWRGWQACKSQAAGPLPDVRETRDAANMSIISKWAAISSSHKSWHYSSENRCHHGFAANAATNSKGRLVMIWWCLLPNSLPHWKKSYLQHF